MASTQGEVALRAYFVEVRKLGEQDRQHRMNATVKACKVAGWSYTALGRALGLSTARARQMAHAYDGRDVGQLPPVPVPEEPQESRPPAGDTEAEALRRVQAAGWDPAEPYPGMLTAFWRLRCATCGREERRKPVPKVVRCRHLDAARAEEQANRERQAIISARRKKLTTKNLRALEEYPGEGLPWLVQCKFCDRAWRMPEDNLRACPHKGAGDGGTPPLR